MTTDNTTDTDTHDALGIHAVFLQAGPDHTESLIERALGFRRNASQGTRDALDAAIRKNVRLDGFRDSSRAPIHQLKGPVGVDIILGNGRMAGAVLRAWAESHAELQDLVVEHLRSVDIPAQYPDFKTLEFGSVWPREEWEAECEAFMEDRTDLDSDDVATMLCYVTGRIPGAPAEFRIQSELFTGLLEKLDELPVSAPEWAELADFIDALGDIEEQHYEVRNTVHAKALEEYLKDTIDVFDDDLKYLDIDLAAWKPDDRMFPGPVKDSLGLLEELRHELEAYSLVRPQASSRSEEASRAVDREERESAIFDIVSRHERVLATNEAALATIAPSSEEPAPGDDSPADLQPSGEVASSIADAEPTLTHQELDSLKAELEGLKATIESVKNELVTRNAELEKVNATIESTTSENEELKQTNSGLQSDMALLRQENSELRSEIARIQEMEEYWRQSYVSLRSMQTVSVDEEPPQLASVNDALELASRTFPGQLVVSLNSKSTKNSPFQKPDEVFGVLAWLATEYHRLRRQANQAASPDFNKLIKEACPGWFYKPGQTEITTEQFAGWYNVTVDGKSYELVTHIGKGNSHDPQNTIRIAFAWDDELNRVVVGFLGLHQRNRRS